MSRPVTATTYEPLSVDPISSPTCCCGLQEGLNIEGCLPTAHTESQVKILQGHPQSPSSVHLFTLRKYLNISHQKLYSAFMAIIQD